MQDVLDNQNVIAQKDPYDALSVAAKEWTQLTADHEVLGAVKPQKFAHVVVAGMGGSGLAAGMAKDWLNLPIPLDTVKSYNLPAYVGKETLVIASSYSGNTEETLSATREALERGATVAAIANGGELIELAKKHELVHVQLKTGIQPRMAVFANLVALLTLLEAYGVSDRLLSGVRPKAEVVELTGESVIAQMLWGGVLADFVSIYLAILNGVDPTKVDLIEKLKTDLK